MGFKISNLRLQPHLPGANVLNKIGSKEAASDAT